MNAIWEHFPDYATVYNLAEQSGLNSISGPLLDIVDKIDLSVRPEKMITITPGVGTNFIDTSYCMKQEDVEKYVEKLGNWISSCTYIQKYYNMDTKAKYHNNPQLSEIWLRGANNGIMVHFICTLTDGESKINDMVLREIEFKVGDPDLPIDMNDYIDAALIVLERLGYHIPIQSDGGVL